MDAPFRDLSSLKFRNVLIVDDQPEIHEMYQHALAPEPEPEPSIDARGDIVIEPAKESFNFALHSALSGPEALERVKHQEARRSPIQLAFIDMKMSEWNGVETIRQLNNFDPRISFVIVTGFPQAAQEELMTQLGAVAFRILPKPFDLAEIYEISYSLVSRWNRLHVD